MRKLIAHFGNPPCHIPENLRFKRCECAARLDDSGMQRQVVLGQQRIDVPIESCKLPVAGAFVPPGFDAASRIAIVSKHRADSRELLMAARRGAFDVEHPRRSLPGLRRRKGNERRLAGGQVDCGDQENRRRSPPPMPRMAQQYPAERRDERRLQESMRHVLPTSSAVEGTEEHVGLDRRREPCAQRLSKHAGQRQCRNTDDSQAQQQARRSRAARLRQPIEADARQDAQAQAGNHQQLRRVAKVDVARQHDLHQPIQPADFITN